MAYMTDDPTNDPTTTAAPEARRCACVADGQRCYEREGRPFPFDESGFCRPCQNNHRGYLRSSGATD